MKDTIWVKLVLGLSGIIGVWIGLSVLFWTRAFFASSGIVLGDDASLMSEIRAPAMVLVLFGSVTLAAIFTPRIRTAALWAGALLYLSYGAGRVISMVMDGVPHANLLMALGIEIVVGLLCVHVLRTHRVPA